MISRRVKISDDHLLDKLSRAEDGHRLPAGPHRHLSMRNRQAPTPPSATLFLPPPPPGQHSTVPEIRAGWCCRGSFGARQQTLPKPVRRALSRDQPGSTVRRCGGPGADTCLLCGAETRAARARVWIGCAAHLALLEVALPRPFPPGLRLRRELPPAARHVGLQHTAPRS